MDKEAILYDKLEGNLVKCNVCPRRCYIKPGTIGFCKVRENRGGILYAVSYGKLTAANVDPIEKKPLYHFYPGSLSFSISSFGCSFTCPWCQNWSISQLGLGEVPYDEASPEWVVEAAKRAMNNIIHSGMLYLYNESAIKLAKILN